MKHRHCGSDCCQPPGHADFLLNYVLEPFWFYFSYSIYNPPGMGFYLWYEKAFIRTVDYKVKPARILKTSSFFSSFFLTHGTLSWPWPYKIPGGTLHSVFLPSCCFSQVLLPTLPASLLCEQTDPARERGCPSVFLKPRYFMKNGLGASLEGWSVSGKSQGKSRSISPPVFPIFCLYRLGREGDQLETPVRIWDLNIA